MRAGSSDSQEETSPGDSQERRESFRDPDGFIFRQEDHLYRAVKPAAIETLNSFLASPSGRSLSESNCLVRSWPAQAELPGWEVLEHEPVFFPSYPYEWPAEMLYTAGRLTLELAERILEDGFGLKDATPYNILFRGARPVFVDMLSFERRAPGDPIWLPYAQYVRTFLLPLARQRMGLGAARDVFLANRDGLTPEQLYAVMPAWRRLLPPYLTLISIPAWSGRRAEQSGDLYTGRKEVSAERARFTLRIILHGLRRQLDRLKPRGESSIWKGYESSRTHYGEEQIAAKKDFVERVLGEIKPRTVLDVGANLGEFSAITAKAGASTVAIDSDAAAVSECFRRAETQNLDILPLVIDFSRPSPAIGWRNEEHPSFLDRAMGRFDAVLMLAVVHHLTITERVPLDEIFTLAKGLTRDVLVVEHVACDDPMVQRLARGRDALYAHATRDFFEAQCSAHFDLMCREEIRGTRRTLYALRRRA